MYMIYDIYYLVNIHILFIKHPYNKKINLILNYEIIVQIFILVVEKFILTDIISIMLIASVSFRKKAEMAALRKVSLISVTE